MECNPPDVNHRRGVGFVNRVHTDVRMKADTPVNSAMSVGQARKLVEQLKIEASFCRIKVSKAAADLMAYCDAHSCDDPLITPVPTSENPFREKKFFCALL
ncbi:Guanine nucleotide-binding protein G(I)/G(S)/G(O) subunit gamma-3 [Liparis tanakae]|uniref:Guanine nucleotide-binding protein subunit gamma n=1 Tax=Liparis tanakae TaxID=230148 RepID=A0A4Z2IZ09_9TELE|nr:Guanine nucleotide-binding protein G(I)/G(S)/G(O) subunit gamma-3 [Liparis tanakae]